jgi:hypothetical protein
MASPQSDTSRAEATPREAEGDTINRPDEPRNKEISASRSNWKKAFLSKLRDFLITRSVED